VRIVAVRERTVPLASPIRNAWISFAEMTCSIVAVVTDVVRDGRPVVGFGFNSNGRYGQGGLLRERFIPRLLAADPRELLDAGGGNLDPARLRACLMRNEKPGGHGERSVAVGTLDMAAWDVVAKVEGRPLADALAARHGRSADPSVRVYAAGGYYQTDKPIESLQAELRRYLDRGFTTVKMKIGGAPLQEDLARIEAAIAVTGHPDRVAVDANGRLSVPDALAVARAIEPLGLAWYEEPVDPLDYAGHAEVARAYDGPLATGENLFSVLDVRNLVRHGGLRPDRDLLQMDPVLGYGLVEYVEMIELLEASGWNRRSLLPHGGHLLNLHAAAGLGLGGVEAYPEVFEPYGGWGEQCNIADGRATVPQVPGLGLETHPPLRAILDTLLD
jgi:L-alanine-DL-glutamate epimerase-like enolase superfamily enzyme